jgi:CubicO group peptidase (beta-lactamase class C family)
MAAVVFEGGPSGGTRAPRLLPEVPMPGQWRKSPSAIFILLVASLLLFVGGCAAQEDETRPPQSLEELQAAIEDVLAKTRVPGAGVALVSRDEVLWVAGIGTADRATAKPVLPDTLFRVGSISKSFVALSALLLVEQGRLRLDAEIRELIPEIEFTNQWEDTDPVRLVHLLEHTTGFDDIHLREYALDGRSLTLRQGLDFHPHSRTARWTPGTHFSYCNAGPAVAAYVIEKVSRQPFEDFVQQHFFDPLEMKTASFFLTQEVEQTLAKGYERDGSTESPYWHIAMRPAGAINASPREMANFVQFLLNRGRFQGVALLQPESIQRMETPQTTLAARAGLRAGYALGNYTQSEDGFLFHGHDGGVGGYLASYAYLPEEGVGYVYMINAGNGRAFDRIGKLVRAYLTRDLPRPAPPAPAHLPPERLQRLTGYYEPITPRIEISRFFTRLIGIVRITSRDGRLYFKPLFREGRALIPVTERKFRGEKDPVATAVFLDDPSGQIILQDAGALAGDGNYRSRPAALVWFQWLLAIAVLGLMTSSVSFALFWLFRMLYKGVGEVKPLSVRVLPLVAVVSLAAAFALLLLSFEGARMIWRFGRLTAWSVSYFVLSWLFAVTAVVGLVQALRARSWEMRRGVRIHSLLVSLANVLALLYLGYWGLIGLRLWAY